MKDFFISYTSVDKAWAEWIAWQLEEAGYQVVIQAWDFRPGGNFVLDMQNAAAQSERTIAVLSPDFLKSLYTQPEWAAAFAQDPNGEKGTLIPVRVRTCKLTGLLNQIVYINLVGLDEKAAAAALLQGIKSERVKPASPPGFPGAGAAPARAFPALPPFPGASRSPASAENTPPAPITAARIRDLERHLREGQQLLKEYEEIVRLSSNPKERTRARKEIKTLQSQLRKHQKELDRLTGKTPSTGSEPAHVVNIHTGGGAYIAGNVQVGGDFVGRDKVDHSIGVGDITGSADTH